MTRKSLEKPKLLLVEGKGEVRLFNKLLEDIKLSNDLQVEEIGGKDNFKNNLPALKNRSGFHQVTNIGIVRDADNDPQAAFQSVCDVLKNNALPCPSKPTVRTKDRPHITIFIVPDENRSGMLETLCWDSVAEDPALECVERYFACLTQRLKEDDYPKNQAKANVQAFLASRDWLELAHFEYIQQSLANYQPSSPISTALDAIKIKAFLASRYTPDLRLGEAAEKGYWDFSHPAFAKVKDFLQNL